MTDERDDRIITFRGRELSVHLPTPEQVVVWKRTLKRLQSPDVDGWDGNQVVNALGRARDLVDSILVNPDDSDWLDEETMQSNLGLAEMSEIINMTVAAFSEGENRKSRRAATKKAARKAAPKKTTR